MTHVVLNVIDHEAIVCNDITQISKIIDRHTTTINRHKSDSPWCVGHFIVYFDCQVMKSRRGGKAKSR